MKTRILLAAGSLLLAGWWLAQPQLLPPGALPEHPIDLQNGERMFLAGGCGNCHGRMEDGKPNSAVLAGGMKLVSPAGLFRVPNITPHTEHGIGDWTDLDFINAMKFGVDPAGRHLYPAFPYTSYVHMSLPDLLDLKAWLDHLPADANEVAGHDLGFPWNQRWALGYWKRLFLDEQPALALDDADELVKRGQYLVEGPGHCGECHTPRNTAWAMDRSAWLAGAPSLEDEGKVPNITPHDRGLAGWSESDIVYYLESGVDPDFDIVGGPMVAVQEELSKLPESDRQAIAAYLKRVPPRAGD